MAYNAFGGFPSRFQSLDTGDDVNPHRNYKNHVYLVYIHINKINGDVYVGITHHMNPSRRWGSRGNYYGNSVKFIRAIKKYNWDNFEHIVLCRTTKERAIVMEKAMIAHYKRLGKSYNLADGGEGTDCITEQNREAIRKRMNTNHPWKGRHHTLEARAKISEALRKRVMKESTRQKLAEKVWSKMSGIHKFIKPETFERFRQMKSRPVFQLDLEGNIINEFPSVMVAEDSCCNGKRGNHISDVCNGKRKTAHGYKWKYKEERSNT